MSGASTGDISAVIQTAERYASSLSRMDAIDFYSELENQFEAMAAALEEEAEQEAEDEEDEDEDEG